MIVAVPSATPVTFPVVAFTDAIDALLLLHVPPAVASLSKIVWPTHTVAEPDIDAGNAFTVMLAVAIQPVVSA